MEAINFHKLFHKGPETWNDWRKNNPNRIPDLTEVTLKNVIIEDYDFSKINFEHQVFSGSTIDNVDFSSSNLSYTDFKDATIINSNFFKADLFRAYLSSTILKNCSLFVTNANYTRFYGTRIENCLIDENTNFAYANFDNALIVNSNVEEANIKESNLKECDFEGKNKTLLESFKKEQKEIQRQLLERKKEAQKKRKQEREERWNKKAALETEFDKIKDLPEEISKSITELDYKLKIKKGYLKAFKNKANFNKLFTDEIKGLTSEIEIKKKEYKKLIAKRDKVKKELSQFQERVLYSLARDGDYKKIKYVSKKEVETEFKKRKITLDLPEQFDKNLNKKKNINIGVYSVNRLEKGTNTVIQVWIYKNKLIEEISLLAKQFNPDVSETARKSLFNLLTKGDAIKLILNAHEISYTETKELFWNGTKACENFLIKVPKEIEVIKITFSLDILIEGLLSGNVHFSMAVTRPYSIEKNDIKPIDYEIQAYEKAFISYASSDRQEVLARVQGMLLTERYNIFLDVINLSGAEKWEPRLYKEIETCDVFFLFWSKASKASKWVKKEIQFALDCKKDSSLDKPRIHPIMIPPIQAPPKNLSNLHCNDPITQFILADKQRKKNNFFHSIFSFFKRH